MDSDKTPNYELAYKDYLADMKYKDIAKKYNVSLSAVKSWAARYWKKGCDQKEQKLQPKRDKVATRKTKHKEVIAEEVNQVIDNPDLTDKQRLFCLHYVRCFNATKAYQKAYGCKYDVANAEGYKLLVKPCVKAEIISLKQNRLNRELIDEHDIFQKYMDIAFSDIADYVSFGKKEIKYNDKAGNEQTAEVSYVDLKDSKEVDGTLLTEISQGKDGVKVKLADRMKALQWISDHMDIATEEQRSRIAQIKAQTEKLKSDAGEEDETKDDGFLEALNDAADKDWS